MNTYAKQVDETWHLAAMGIGHSLDSVLYSSYEI